MPRATHPRPSYGRRSPRQARPRLLACEVLESRHMLSGLAELLNPPAFFPAPSDLNQPGSTQATAADTQERRDLTYLAQSLPTAELPVFDQVDTPLLLLYSRYLQGSTIPVGQQTINGTPYGDVFSTDGTRPHVQAFVQSAVVARSALAGLGMEVTAVTDTPSWQVVAGYLPVDAIDDAAHVAGLGVLQASERGTSEAQGAASNQWETVSYADQLKRVLTSVDGSEPNIDGRIEIGVISDSINQVGNGVADSQNSGDLPLGNRVQVLDDGPAGGKDEGRAMAELVYDIGPAFNIRFHSGSNSAADMAAAYDELRQAGADIITEDISYFKEPVFQDGQIAQAVDSVYLDHGVLVFGSGGNHNNKSYNATWRDDDGDGFHEFADGDETVGITLANGEKLRVYLQWSQFWGVVWPLEGTDIDVQLFSADLSTLLVDSDVVNNLPLLGDLGYSAPLDTLTYTNNSGAAASYQLAFRFEDGTAPDGLALQMFAPKDKSAPPGNVFTEAYTQNQPAIPGNHAATNMFTLGAVGYTNPSAIEGFSSRGPQTLFFGAGGMGVPEVREKPDFVAADRVDTTFFGSNDIDGSGFNDFFGTSAASPNAAAVAGLVLDAANRRLSYDELSQIFAETATGTGAGAWDPAFGEGLIHALGAGLVARGFPHEEAYVELNPFGDGTVWGNDVNISADTDTDGYAFAFESDGPVAIGVSGGGGLREPGLILWSSESGSFVEIDYKDQGWIGGGFYDSRIQRELASWELYQAEVFEARALGANVDSYTLKIDGPDPQITAISLDARGDGAARGAMENRRNADYFRIVAPETAGNELTVTLAPEAALNGVLTLYDADGDELARQDVALAGQAETIEFENIVKGATYYLRVGAARYASAGGYDLEVDFEMALPAAMTDAEGFAYFHSDGTSHDTQTFSDFSGAADITENIDVDSFFFAGEVAGDYTISVTPRSGDVAPLVAVYDAATGEFLGSTATASEGTTRELRLPLAARHRYIVAVADDDRSGTGDVEIVIQGPEVLPTTLIAIGPGGTANLAGQELRVPEDSDFFAFTAPADADGTLTLTVSPFWIGLDTAAILLDAAGNELAKSYLPGGGEDDVIAFDGVVPSTTYYLTVLSKDYADQGAYDVSLQFGLVRGVIRGTKFYDLDQDGVFDEGEPGLEDWVVYADLDDDQVFDPAGRIEPDDYADGTLLGDMLPTVHLWAAGQSVNNTFISVVSGRPASTGWKVFGNGWSDRAEWADLDAYFVAKIFLPVSRVSLDFIADDAADTGVLVAYDRQNRVIAQVATGAMNAGEAKTLTVQVPGNDIDYVSATGGAGHPVQLDNFRFGLGPGEPFALTDMRGQYAMEDLPLDTYHVREVLQDLWQQTAPAGGEQSVTLSLQAPDAAGADFGNYSAPQIHGIVWEDLNGDGVRDAGEPGLAGWTIFDDWDGDGEPNPFTPATLTNASGEFWFAGIEKGSHSIAEVLPPNWAQSWPEGWPLYDVDLGWQLIDGIDFGNYQYSTASGFVFNDLDENGLRDQGEPGLDGWEMFVDLDGDGARTVGDPWDTVDGGQFTIMNIPPGDYRLLHAPQVGWAPVVPADDYYDLSVTSGSTLGYFNFAEHELLDFGDAPPPYPTRLADNGPRHRITLYSLGPFPDEERDGVPRAAADGDDTTGMDDEDGVTFLTPLVPGQPADIRVNVVTNDVTLDAWLDFNRDGDWDDAGERILDHESLAPLGWQTLSFDVPGWSVPGVTYGRFRVSKNGVASYTGPADSGEVEDYRVEIENPFNVPLVVPPLEDYGPMSQLGDRNITLTLDSPTDRATWRFSTKAGGPATFTATGNANSGLHPLLALYNGSGDLVAIGGGQPDPGENVLSYVLTPGVDEVYTLLVQDAELDTAGVVQTSFDTPTVSAIETIALDAAGLGSVDGTLITYTIPPLADVDYYQLPAIGGGSPDPGERLAVKVSPLAPYRLELQLFDGSGNPVGDRVLSPVDGQPAEHVYTALPGGQSYVVAVFPHRFEDHPASGDYHVEVGIDTYDFGDAPASYGTLVADNGPSHLIVPGLYLGSRVDSEWEGQPTVAADGDDTDASGDDEDGVVFVGMSPGVPTDVQVTASAAGMLDAWVDFNADGGFDVGEQVFTSEPLVAGPNDLTIRVPIGAAVGQTYARFRFSSTGGLSSGGAAADGEVEDYRVAIEPSGEIRGTVWHDLDTSGTRGSGEPGLAGWTVFLDDDNDGQFDSSSEQSVQTDSGGNYAFSDVPPGNYNVAQLLEPNGRQTFPLVIPERVYVLHIDRLPAESRWSFWTEVNGVEVLDFDLNLDISLPADFEVYPAELEEGRATDIEIGPGGDVYVSVDGFNDGPDRIVQFTYDMEFVRAIELPADIDPALPESPYFYPVGFDVLADGSLLVAQPNSRQIVQLSPDGSIAETFGLPLFKPVDAGITSDGFIAFSERGLLNVRSDDLIWVASSDGTVLQDIAGTVFMERLPGLEALEIGDGSLFLLDAVDGNMLKLDAAGEQLANYDMSEYYDILLAIAVSRNEVPFGNGPVRGAAAAEGFVVVGPEGSRLVTDLTVTGASEILVPTPANPVQTGRGSWSVVVQPGQVVTGADFGNVQESTASGVKFNDLDGDGIHDTAEPGLDGWVVWADLDDDGERDGREPAATTHDGGLFTLQGILPGTFKIREEAQPGWTQTAPAAGYREVQFISGSAVTGLEFGNRQAFHVFVVNSTADPGDGVPNAAELTLREAITAANATTNLLEPDRILFDIPAGDPGHVYYRNDGVAGQVSAAQVTTTSLVDDSLLSDADPEWSHSWFTVRPTTDLPWISDPVVIDGYSQDGSRWNINSADSMRGLNSVLKIDLDGGGTWANGLVLDSPAGGSTVRGLVINRSGGSGIVLSKGNGHVIEGNYIGTDPSGTLDLGNFAGLYVGWSGSSGNLIGGLTPAARNLISGNSGDGLRAVTTGNRVVGNLIGTDRSGTRAIRNDSDAVDLAADENIVGGTEPGSRNILSGNGFTGVFITGSNNLVQGNFIGTDVTGKVALGNATHGVRLVSTGNVIGGTDGDDGTVDGTVSARNVISANLQGGISIEWSGAGTANTRVQGNFIGTDAAGEANLGNGFDTSGGRYGGVIVYLAADSLIGGTEPGAGNRIAFNAGEGVLIRSTTGHAILSNAIFANGRLGIDLGEADGVTPNDAGDADTGANNRQNFPAVTSAIGTATDTTIAGSLNSTPTTALRIELFANETADPSGFGEGQVYLGSIDVTTDSAGDASFDATIPIALPSGQFITATATVLLSGGGFGDSSEYSQAAPVTSTATGEIHGTVWRDANTDGSRGTEEPGLAGWTVFLDSDGDGVRDSDEASTTSDAGGNYAFAGLEPGSYNVAQSLLPNWLQTHPVVVPEWVYVAEWDSLDNIDVIKIFDFDGNLVDSFDLPVGHSGDIHDVEIGPAGDVYVGLHLSPFWGGPDEILQFTYDGKFLRAIQLPEEPGVSDEFVNYPYGFDVLPDGMLLVAQPHGEQIVLLDSDGSLVETFALPGVSPRDVAVRSDGEILYTASDLDVVSAPMLNVRSDDLHWQGGQTSLFDRGTLVRSLGVESIDVLEASDGSVYATSDQALRKWDAEGTRLWIVLINQHTFQGLAVARNEVPFSPGDHPELFLSAFGAAAEAGLRSPGAGGPLGPSSPASAAPIPTGRGNYNVVVGAGEVAQGVDFGNVEASAASGVKFHDVDGDGTRDAGEPGLDGWTIWADLDDDGVRDGREPSATTAGGGLYAIAGIMPGIYKVREEAQPGWSPTDPGAGYHEVHFLPGSMVENLDFGNRLVADFGDAPASYATLLADNGAYHALVTSIHLGNLIDAEPDGQPTPAADGDDLAGADDDDGVRFLNTLIRGQQARIEVIASAPGALDAWIDFNVDGDWSDAGERIFAARPLVLGVNPLSFLVPSFAVDGSPAARFRFSADGVPSFDGAGPAGEVEDYVVRLYEQNPNFVVNVPAARANNRLILRRSGDRAQLVDARNNRLLFNQPLAAIESLTILGAANRSDLLTLDVGYGGSFVIPSGILFDGGAGTRAIDRLLLRGTTGDDAFSVGNASTSIEGLAIEFHGLEQLTLNGGPAGNDSYQVSDLSAKTTLVDRKGMDLLDFSEAAAGVTIDLGKILGQPQKIFASNPYRLALKGTVENVTGSPQADRIAGNSAANAIRGGDGSDTLFGRAGNDILYGEAGDDWLYGDAGSDSLYGGPGNNVLLGGAGSDVLDVNADVTAAGRNLLIGGLGIDAFQGGPGEEILIGGATKYDGRKAALDLIMKQWTSDNAWEDRRKNLETGITDPTNPKLGAIQLKRKNDANRNGTVLDDRARDSLLGSLGSDWFFDFASDDVRDRGPEDR